MAIVLAGGELAAQGHQPSSMSIRHLPSLNAAKPSLSGASQVGNLPKQSQRFGRPTVVPAQSFSEVVPSSARLNQQPPQQSEVRFAQAAQPEAVQPPTLEVIPTPGLSPAPQSSRGSLLLGLPPELRTPRPTPEVERRFGQFVEDTISPENTLQVVVGRTVVLQLRATPRRVFIPDEEVARIEILDRVEGRGRQLAVIGKEPGTTVLNLWFPDPADPEKEQVLSYLVAVVEDPEPVIRSIERFNRQLQELEDEIAEAFPDSHVKLSSAGGRIVVRGEAKDVVEATEIMTLVGEFSGDENPRDLPPNLAFALADNLDGRNSAVAEEVLRDYFPSPYRNIVSLLRIPGEQQVMLRVTVAEIDRTAARNIGMDFLISNDDGNPVFGQLTGGLLDTQTGGGSTLQNTGSNLPAIIDNGQVILAIQALRQLSFARTLAEPNLVTMNGRTANFQAGGQFPVPVVTGFTASGLQGVAFVPFGVQLAFTPVITDRDRIRLTLAADVSATDSGGGTNIGGSNVPGLNTRNVQTTVELREGQTLAVAGLIQTTLTANSDRVPLWGDLPVIGRTGGFDRTSASERELVILITPELVHPLEACETPAVPGSDVFEPGDLEFYLGGHLESRRSYDFRSTVRTDWHRIKRYHDCEDVFIIGEQGHSCCVPYGGQSDQPCVYGP